MAFRIDGKCLKCNMTFEFIHGETKQTKEVENIFRSMIENKKKFNQINEKDKKILTFNLLKNEIDLINKYFLEEAAFYINTFYLKDKIKYFPMVFLKIDSKLYKRKYKNAIALKVQTESEFLMCAKCEN